jgi:molybdate transport system substrate-binding protein
METLPASGRVPLVVFTSNAARAVLDSLAALYERESGQPVAVHSDSASVMLARIRSGEIADAAVLNAPDVETLVKIGLLRASGPFARSLIGVAVRRGARHPDIASAEALKRALLEAGTLAHTVHGASGKLVPALLQRLGIADEITTVTCPGGLIAALVAAGEAEIAIQQISELLAVPGVEVVGPLPDPLQTVLESAAAIFTGSCNADAAEALLGFLHAPASAAVMREKGLEPASPRAV